jgi:hypothetical protein
VTGKAPRGADYVGHMLEAIAKVLSYTAGSMRRAIAPEGAPTGQPHAAAW